MVRAQKAHGAGAKIGGFTDADGRVSLRGEAGTYGCATLIRSVKTLELYRKACERIRAQYPNDPVARRKAEKELVLELGAVELKSGGGHHVKVFRLPPEWDR